MGWRRGGRALEPISVRPWTVVHHDWSVVRFGQGAAWSGHALPLRARPTSLTGLRRAFTSGKWSTRDDGQWPPAKSDRHTRLLSALISFPCPGVMFRRCARKMTLSLASAGAHCAIGLSASPTLQRGRPGRWTVDTRSTGQTPSKTVQTITAVRTDGANRPQPTPVSNARITMVGAPQTTALSQRTRATAVRNP
jgi:hypothetical protein